MVGHPRGSSITLEKRDASKRLKAFLEDTLDRADTLDRSDTLDRAGFQGTTSTPRELRVIISYYKKYTLSAFGGGASFLKNHHGK